MNTKQKTKLSNQSLVFTIFGDNEKLTVSEVLARVNENISRPASRISERTVRRALESLESSGHIKTYGRANNAILYGKLSASWVNAEGNEKLVPFAGELMTVEDFLKAFVLPESKPLQLKMRKFSTISTEAEHVIRRRMAAVILTASEAGMQDVLHGISKDLHAILNEYKFIVELLENFLNSAVWFEQYRDRMAKEVRNVQQNDPELFQLAVDYVRSQ